MTSLWYFHTPTLLVKQTVQNKEFKIDTVNDNRCIEIYG